MHIVVGYCRGLTGIAFLGALLPLLPETVAAARVSAPATDLIAGEPGQPWRRLFLDAMVVEEQQGLQRVFHAASKHPANPVLRGDRPWESPPSALGPYLYGTVMWDGGKLRMWYHTWGKGGYRNMYAESTDGLHWDKPSLGLVEFEGSTDNNLFLTDSVIIEEPDLYQGGGKCHNPSVIKQPWESDPAKRYALYCYSREYGHARVAFSPDGLRWSFVPETARAGLFSSSDVLNFFHDPYVNRYVATWKSHNRRGRAVGVAVSTDGLTWTKPLDGPVFVADDLDPDATQVYGMPVFPYQGLYIGLPWIYKARWFKSGSYSAEKLYEAELGSPCTMDTQLAWSWDLINWTRPPAREAFIPRGQPGAFDDGGIYTARAPVQMGGELWFYYGGFDGPHNDPKAVGQIGVATLRLDGFCSMRAGRTEGALITRRELLPVPEVLINARTGPYGYVAAELLDRDDRVIPGFSRRECRVFTGDSIGHRLSWSKPAFPASLMGSEKKIRFILRQADLYSYLPETSSGPRAFIWDLSVDGDKLPDDPSYRPDLRFRWTGVPGSCRLVSGPGVPYLDLHSVGGTGSSACYFGDAVFGDATNWCMETWLRVVDQGTEPHYGLACFMRPDHGRDVALYLREDEVGLLSSEGAWPHRVLESVPFDTTDGFHWYRMVHEGGEAGTVSLAVDGQEVIRIPFTRLYVRNASGDNVSFGPNAADCEGRLHVAKFGYRLAAIDPLFGPVPAE